MTSAASGTADHDSILAAAREWAGAPMALATVVATWSSAPCPTGSHMLVHADGRFAGSVSGGCVEGEVLHLAGEIIAGAPFVLRSWGVPDDAVWEAGLPCGGDIRVLIQPVTSSGFDPLLFARIDSDRAAGRTTLIATDLETGASRVATGREPGTFTNVYAPPRRLLIVGAVEIARTLARVAQDTGFAVTVIDPRARFLTSERFPGMTLDDRWPDEAIAALRPDSRTAVITLSHDPKIDDPALKAALAFPTAHIGALGSRRSHAARLERLAGQGIAPETLARIEGPAGVAINAISAPEIALSIHAGVVKRFNEGLR